MVNATTGEHAIKNTQKYVTIYNFIITVQEQIKNVNLYIQKIGREDE